METVGHDAIDGVEEEETRGPVAAFDEEGGLAASSEDIERISLTTINLQQGTQVFKATGYSLLKVSRRHPTDAGKTQTVVFEVPIKATGVAEIIEEFDAEAPQPPSRREKVTPSSPMGQEYAIKKAGWFLIPDLGDANYVRAQSAHSRKVMYAIMDSSLDLVINGEDGEEITDGDARRAAMRKLGFTADHFMQIAADARGLTQFSDQEQEKLFQTP